MRILFIVKSDSLRKSLGLALRNVYPDAHFFIAKDTSSAHFEIEKEKPYKYIFVQYGYTQREVISIIEAAKKYDISERARLVLLANEEEASEQLLSNYLSLGFSGLLVEPFSIDAVKEVLTVSSTLSSAGSVARLTVAAGLQIKAQLVGENKMDKGGKVLDSVKKACQIFENENPGITLQSVAEDLSKMNLEERVKVNVLSIYRGVSDRVRQLVNRKMTTTNK